MEWECKCTRCNNSHWEKAWGLKQFDEQNLALRVCELFLQAVQSGQTTSNFKFDTRLFRHQDTWGGHLHDTLRGFQSDLVLLQYDGRTLTYYFKWTENDVRKVVDRVLITSSLHTRPLFSVLAEQQKRAVQKLKKVLRESPVKKRPELSLMVDVIANMRQWFYGFDYLYDVEWESREERSGQAVGGLVFASRVGILAAVEVSRFREQDASRNKAKEQAKAYKANCARKHTTKSVAVMGAYFTNGMEHPEYVDVQDTIIAQSVAKSHAVYVAALSSDEANGKPNGILNLYSEDEANGEICHHKTDNDEKRERRCKRTGYPSVLGRSFLNEWITSLEGKYRAIVRYYKVTIVVVGNVVAVAVIIALILLARDFIGTYTAGGGQPITVR